MYDTSQLSAMENFYVSVYELKIDKIQSRALNRAYIIQFPEKSNENHNHIQ